MTCTQNLLLNTDSYKLSHAAQYPPGTTEVSSYIESRGGALDEIVFFGLQAFLKSVLSKPITRQDIDEAEALALAHMGLFNREGWKVILERHNGFLPLEIQALQEGSVVSPGVPVVQVRNTDPDAFWLVSHIETALLRAVWYPSTVASVSFACKRILRDFIERTSDAPEALLPLQLHDFGARGATSDEAAGLGGLAHLVNFRGTDTLAALLVGRRHYGADVAGISIPASEHSTMTSWGRDGVVDAYANMIRQFGGEGRVLAFVVDSYDLWNSVDEIVGKVLAENIRNTGGRVVIRPDSGVPEEVVPVVIERLMAAFGHTVNGKGYKVLPDFIRIIQGDGVTLDSLPRILKAMTDRGLSTENAAFGMGGGLLQKVDRDTLRWAMKASQIVVRGQVREIYKDPVTDPGKRSKTGRQAVVEQAGRLAATREADLGGQENLLQTVWLNGVLKVETTLDQVRERAEASLGALGGDQ